MSRLPRRAFGSHFMHQIPLLTLSIFVAGYITARWDVATRLYELAVFAWDKGVVVCCRKGSRFELSLTKNQQARTAKGFALLSVFFFLFILPVVRVAVTEAQQVCIHGHILSQPALTPAAPSITRRRYIRKRTITEKRLVLSPSSMLIWSHRMDWSVYSGRPRQSSPEQQVYSSVGATRIAISQLPPYS